MDFVFDKHTPLPPHAQIQEQIKLALLLGRLRPGDTLPSIRDVEKQVGISRNLVRKAYVELQSSGILSLHHGKGVIVDKTLQYPESSDLSQKCESVSRELTARLRQMGVAPTSFVRYLHQYASQEEARHPFLIFVDATRSVAQERASRISSVWRMSVPGISIDELGAMEPMALRKIRKVLTNYLRYDEVVQTINAKEPEVIPLGLSFEGASVREFAALPKGSSVVFVLDDRDYPSLTLILELYRRILLDPSGTIDAVPLSQIPDLKRFLRSKRYRKFLFSNRIWEKLPDEIKHHPKVTRPHMSVDLGSLENARIRAGVII